MSTDRRRIAFHEAGHAVVAYRLGFDSGTVTILPNTDQGTRGSSSSEDDDDDATVVVLYAGLAGERLVAPDSGPENGAWGDYERAAEIHGLPSPPAHLEEQATSLVKKNRDAIDAVAEALLRDNTLAADEHRIIVDAVDEGRDWQADLHEYRSLRKST